MTLKRRLLPWLSAVQLLILSATGCDRQSPQAPQQQSLIYCADGIPESLNPQRVITSTSLNATASHLFNRLVRYDPLTRQVVPELAVSWHIGKDQLSYTFTLRENVQFHQTAWFQPTRPLEAEDVLLSFQRLIDPRHPLFIPAPDGYPFFDSLGFSQLIHRLTILDPRRIRITLRRHQSDFLHILASDFAVILSAEYASQLLASPTPQLRARFDALPVGTGPFKIRNQHHQHWLRLEQHARYWRGPTLLPQVVIDYTPSPDRRLAKLFSGECDVAALPPLHALPRIKQSDDLILQRQQGANVAYLAFNTRKPPLDSLDVRRAIALALDPEALISRVYAGMASPTRRLLHLPGMAPPQPARQPDPAQARQILAQAGYDSGLELTLWISPQARIYNPSPGLSAEIIQQQLAVVGIRLRVIRRAWPLLRPELIAGSHHLALLGWQADTTSPLHYFSSLLSCGAIASGGNASHWCDPGFEQLLSQAQHHAPTASQDERWQQAEQLISDKLPLLPLASSERIQAKHVTIHGLVFPAIGGVDFTGAYRD